MKRGFLLSLDALAAISLLLLVSVFLAGMAFTYASPELRYQRYYYTGKDMANVIEEAKIESVSDVVDLGKYDLGQDDMDRTILDVVGSFWAEGNRSKAENLTREIFGAILGGTGLEYEVLFSGESIYASSNETSGFLSRLTTVVSGYEKTRPVNGYLARVHLAKVSKSISRFVYFGGYVGDGNVTKSLILPEDASVTGVYMEMNVGSNFSMQVNGNFSGNYCRSAENFSADSWTVCSSSVNPSYCSYFTGGYNSVQINFTDGERSYIGGGYLKVTYKTAELTEGEYVYRGEVKSGKNYLSGIKGLINLYSSFYVPGTVENLSVHLHYFNNLSINGVSIPLYFIIGSKEIYRSNSTGEQHVQINESGITSVFGSKENLVGNMSNSTVPVRFGTDTFAFLSGEGASDSVLITDISGSMEDSCDVQSSECLHPDCNEASGCQNLRIDVAKDTDKEFVSEIINYTGSRVGLVSYNDDVDETHPLGNDSSSLRSQIEGYDANGWTCISCGIDTAIDMILNSRIVQNLVPRKSLWLYNSSFPSTEPPAINGSEWTWQNYSDSGWGEGQAIIGFENTSVYSPLVDTDIGNNGGSYYFRKHFNVSDPYLIKSGEVFILSDDSAEVYINGHLISNDNGDHQAKYWNRGDTVFYDGFEDYYSSGNNRLYYDEINRSPGHWIVDGSPSGDKEVFLMAGYSGYPAYNGTDVLVFRDMDEYGYAETYLDLSGKENLTLSYRWMTGPEAIETGDYADVDIWDGEWHDDVKTYDYNSGEYVSEELDLSDYNMVDNFTVRFGSNMDSGWFWDQDGDDERFYVDDVRVRERITVDSSYFVEGDNVIAVRLRNNDYENAKFDLELNVTLKRHEAILVMSDGYANRCIPGTSCINGSEQAVEQTCEARDKHGIAVYSVAFGMAADNDTLKRMVCWNCSSGEWMPDCSNFYNSSDAEELKNIYRDIARDIANASYQAQILKVSGNVSFDNSLYADSFISFNYTPVVRSLDYGEITLNFESPRLRASTGEEAITHGETGTKEGWFIIPSDSEVATKVLDSKMTSYSSYYWTDRLWVNSSNTPGRNWTRVYWLGNYSEDYEELGDPYTIQIPPNLLKPGGNNSFRIGTGLYPSLPDGLGGSPDDRVIYTLGITGIGLTEYSEILSKAKGSSPTIYYDADGDNIPDSSVIVEVGNDPDDIFDPQNDSIDNGLMRLLDAMNFINDTSPEVVDLNHTGSGPSGTGDGSSSNPVDLEITEEVEFQSDFISQIPSMWGPAVMEVRVWG